MSSETRFCRLLDVLWRFSRSGEPGILVPRLSGAPDLLERSRQIEPDIVGVRPNRQRTGEAGDRLGRVSAGGEQTAVAGVHVGALRLQFQGPAKMALCFLELAGGDEHTRETDAVGGVVWRNLDRG